MGASFARAVKERGVARNVFAWSRGESTRAKCAALKDVFDAVFDTPEAACADADLVVVCAPTANIPQLVKRIAGSLKDGAIVTDVGSVKKTICEESSKALQGTKAVFVGSHPMAGSEKIGIDHSDSKLFENRPCFITPCGDSQLCAARFLEKIWRAVGMRTYSVSPEVHDSIVASVSHMPHIIAGLLCCAAAKFEDGDLREYAGPGFRDTTRISSGNPEIWDSIIADNKSEILRALKHFQADIGAFIAALEKSDFCAVAKMLRDAKAYRDKL